jgi:ATP-dependent DNA ligase
MSISSPAPLGFIRPEIPTLVPEPPAGEGWIHEIKHDGYRALIIIDGGKVRAFSRHGRDWTGPYHRVVEACAHLACKAALMDGEVIVQDENGISDFDALRSAIHKGSTPYRVLSAANSAHGEAGSVAEVDRHRPPLTGPVQRPRRLRWLQVL